MALLFTDRELPPYLKVETLNGELQDREKPVARRSPVMYQNGRNPQQTLRVCGFHIDCIL